MDPVSTPPYFATTILRCITCWGWGWETLGWGGWKGHSLSRVTCGLACQKIFIPCSFPVFECLCIGPVGLRKVRAWRASRWTRPLASELCPKIRKRIIFYYWSGDPNTEFNFFSNGIRAGMQSSCLRSYFNFYLENSSKIDLQDHAKISAYWPRCLLWLA